MASEMLGELFSNQRVPPHPTALGARAPPSVLLAALDVVMFFTRSGVAVKQIVYTGTPCIMNGAGSWGSY